MTEKAQMLFSAQNELGEGPLWHPTEKRLYWVDIAAGGLFRSDESLAAYDVFKFDTMIGAFGFCLDGGLILATKQGFSRWQIGQDKPEILWNPLPDRADVRMNDGKVDPAGRFWSGSMDVDRRQGELYRYDPDGQHQVVLQNIGISNGIDWNPNGSKMYYTDSLQFSIFAFDYDNLTGKLTNQSTFIQLPEDDRGIVPDGLCVDMEGCIWSAHWNGWEVVRYDPLGRPIMRIDVPSQQVTSCCFGGENLDLLFITTARIDLPKESLFNQPLAGNVFVFQTNTQGLPTHFFGHPQQ